MYDTTSVFNVLAADDTERRVSSRRALALAHTRVENRLGSFLRQASSQEDFDARLAACQEEFDGLVTTAAEEHGHDKPENLSRVLRDHYVREAGFNAQAPAPSALPTTPQQALNNQGPHMPPPPATPQQAQQMTGQPAQLPQALQPQDLGQAPQPTLPPQQPGLEAFASRRWTPFLATEKQAMPFGSPLDRADLGQPRFDPTTQPGYRDPYRDVQGDPMNAQWGPHGQADDYMQDPAVFQQQFGPGEYPAEYGNDEPHYEDMYADHDRDNLEANPPRRAGVRTAEEGKGNTGLSGPEPKMDKRKWTPSTVGDPDPDSKTNPTKRKDILEPMKVTNEGELAEIGENKTEHQKLPAANDDGFSTEQKPGTNDKTVNLPSNADPVTRTALD